MRRTVEVNKLFSLDIGYVGENNATEVAFDFTSWAEEYGSGSPVLRFKRNLDEEAYPVTLDVEEENLAVWTVSNTDLFYKGQAEGQLQFVVDDVVKKSRIFSVMVSDSLIPTEDAPDPYDDWMDDLVRLTGESETNAYNAGVSASNAATSALNAATSEANAGTSATNAANSATAAGNSASQANTSANNASASATQAGTYAGNASASATQAQGHANDASASATLADGYADSASDYATAAQGYASDAQGYAEDAQESAEEIEGALQDYVPIDAVANEFDSSMLYGVGAIVAYQGKIYRCTTPHSGTWDSDDFEEVLLTELSGSGGGLTESIKQALLQIATKVAYIDEQGQNYYDDLYNSLYPPKVLVGISAVYTQISSVYDTDSLDVLKSGLVVTALYSDSSIAVTSAYTLSGTLVEGTSIITVEYMGKTTTFSVNVTHAASMVTITNELNGCTNSNSDSSAAEGDSYSATITAESGYTMAGAAVVIIMGGVDITSTAYSGGTVSIPSLTGNLIITITAVLVEVVSISAVYTQSGTVYETDSLNALKADLVVTATYSDSSTEIVASANYTLSGTLSVGTSTITVTYENKTDTFNVTVTAREMLYNWDFTGENPLIDKVNSQTATASGTVTYSSDGLVFGTASSCVVLTGLSSSYLAGKTVEIAFGDMISTTYATTHQRVFTYANTNGLICRKDDHKWSIYGNKSGTNTWQTSTKSQNAVANKTIKLVIHSNTNIDIYLENVLILEGASINTSATSGNVRLGATSNTNQIVKIKSLKVFGGD